MRQAVRTQFYIHLRQPQFKRSMGQRHLHWLATKTGFIYRRTTIAVLAMNLYQLEPVHRQGVASKTATALGIRTTASALAMLIVLLEIRLTVKRKPIFRIAVEVTLSQPIGKSGREHKEFMKKSLFFLIGLMLVSFSGNARELTAADFEKEIANGKKMVEFYSPGCSICKSTIPIVQEYEQNHGTILKLNLVSERAVAEKYKPMRFPVFIVFQDGIEVGRFERPKSVEDIKAGFDSPMPLQVQAAAAPVAKTPSETEIKAAIYDRMETGQQLQNEIQELQRLLMELRSAKGK